MSSDARISKILGFDPATPANGAADALQAALAEIQAERKVENQAKAKELVKKAMELRVKQDKLVREFNAQNAKFEKELGKLLSSIEKMASGTPVTDEEEAK